MEWTKIAEAVMGAEAQLTEVKKAEDMMTDVASIGGHDETMLAFIQDLQ